MARVLVVDDDSDIREGLHHLLASYGHSVTEAENGAVGLERLESTSVDLVLIDIVMPRMEGVETIMKIRRARPGQKIVAMSGSDSKHSYLDFARAFGADAVLAKPFQPAELLETIGSVLTPDWQVQE